MERKWEKKGRVNETFEEVHQMACQFSYFNPGEEERSRDWKEKEREGIEKGKLEERNREKK